MSAKQIYLAICVILALVTLGYWLMPRSDVGHQVEVSGSMQPLPTPKWQDASQAIQTDDITAKAIYIVNDTTSTVLASRQPQHKRAIASLTKMMTALVVIDHNSLDSSVTITHDALVELPTDSTMMGLSKDEKYTIEELLYGLLLTSGNDAAQALAIATSGSQQRFVQEMNAKARQLGLANTHFTNASGLDQPEHYSTAQDLAILAHHFLQQSELMAISATPKKSLPYSSQHKALHLANANSMVTMYPGATGIKPGNTGEAGNCLVATATRDGQTIIGVLLDTPGRNTNMIKLFDRAFAQI